VNGRISSILEKINEPLRVLVIRDSRTSGLFGGEDSEDGNFAPLCKHVLVTPDAKTLGGGSHGLGKAVLWTFSGISAVAFSSIPYGDPDGLRYISRAELPHHSIALGDGTKEEWTGSGWHGEYATTPKGGRANSIRGSEAKSLLGNTPLDRSPDDFGTSILIPFFFEPEQDEPRSLLEIANDTIDSINRWFWPSLITKRLEVSVVVRDDEDELLSVAADGGEIAEPFIEAWSAPRTGEKALAPEELAEQEVPFSPPLRRPGYEPQGKFDGQIKLRVRRAAENETEHEQIDTIALVRGAHMVVRYYKPTVPLEARNFFGVLQVGRAHGTNDEDIALEAFFRAAEPPEHNNWIPTTNNLASRYQQGAKSRLTELWAELSARVKSICKSDVPYEGEGPDALKRFFPLGGDSTPTVPSYPVRFSQMEKINGQILVDATISRKLNNCLPKSWTVSGSMVLKGESGNGESLRMISVVPADGTGIDINVGAQSFSIAASKDVESITLRVTVKDPAIDSIVASRSMVQAKVSGREVANP
jgi:hypothetical protein